MKLELNLNLEKMQRDQQFTENCSANFFYDNEDCKKVCQNKNVIDFSYETNFEYIFGNAFKILFETFGDSSAEYYYDQIKKVSLDAV